MEYKISKINGNQYYGKGDDGTEIHFSAKSILSDDKIQVHDEVIGYFEKNNLGKGLVKVEKIISQGAPCVASALLIRGASYSPIPFSSIGW